jgi:hypothetical protein
VSRRVLAVALLAGLGGACSPAGPALVGPSSPCVVTVGLSAEVSGDPGARAAHLEAFEHVREASGGRVSFQVGMSGAVRAYVAPGEQGEGVAGARGTLAGGELIYSSLYWAGRRPVVEHEVLHLVGLPDTSAEGDLMCAGCESARDPNRGMSEGERAEVGRRVAQFCVGR